MQPRRDAVRRARRQHDYLIETNTGGRDAAQSTRTCALHVLVSPARSVCSPWSSQSIHGYSRTNDHQSRIGTSIVATRRRRRRRSDAYTINTRARMLRDRGVRPAASPPAQTVAIVSAASRGVSALTKWTRPEHAHEPDCSPRCAFPGHIPCVCRPCVPRRRSWVRARRLLTLIWPGWLAASAQRLAQGASGSDRR